MPVSDVDRAKEFYQRAGFNLDVDHRAGEDFRILQLSPQGSGCSGTLTCEDEAAGSVQGLPLIVTDLAAARAELLGRGVEVTELFSIGETRQAPGLHPDRVDFASFTSFSDPDCRGWLRQERRDPAPSSLPA